MEAFLYVHKNKGSKYHLKDDHKIAGISKRYYLLESIEGGEKWGRYSFLGFDPVMHVYCKSNQVTIEKDGTSEVVQTKKPLEVLKKIMKESTQSPKKQKDFFIVYLLLELRECEARSRRTSVQWCLW